MRTSSTGVKSTLVITDTIETLVSVREKQVCSLFGIVIIIFHLMTPCVSLSSYNADVVAAFAFRDLANFVSVWTCLENLVPIAKIIFLLKILYFLNNINRSFCISLSRSTPFKNYKILSHLTTNLPSA